MSPSIFSHNSHLRPQPHSTLAPPSSFSRASAVKHSLRKIPSALFQNKPDHIDKPTKRSKIPIYMDETQPSAVTQKSARSIFSSPKRNSAASNPTTTASAATKEKSKPRTKTRKALADILGWGNHHSNTSVQPCSPPAKPFPKIISHPAPLTATAPPVPPKEINMPTVLKKRPSRALLSSSAHSPLPTTSLRVAQETPQTRARPSMGADPFSRRNDGAEVVDTVVRHGGASSVTNSVISDRRTSVGSTRAASMRTLIDDGPIIQADILQSRHAPPSSYIPIDINSDPLRTVSHSRNVQAGLQPSPVLRSLPQRSAALGRLLDGGDGLPSPASPVQRVDSTCLGAGTKTIDGKTLKREKTKSRVWGIFGGGRRIKTTERGPNSPTPEATTISPTARTVTQFAQADNAPSAAQTSALPSKGSVKSRTTAFNDRPEFVADSTLRRPAPPALHVQKPSVDDAHFALRKAEPQASSPVCPLVHSPRTSSSAHALPSGEQLHKIEPVGRLSHEPLCNNKRTFSTVKVAPKVMPKRKSLTGLFGLSPKRSIDRLRPSSSKSSLKSDEGSTRLPSTLPNGDTLQSLSEEGDAAEMVDKDELSAAALHSVDVFAESQGPKTQGDLRRVASATDKLSALVSLDFSPSATPSDTASLAAPPSLVSVDGSPTPIRRIRSAVLTNKKSASSPLRGGMNISPLKLALHRSQVANMPSPMAQITKGHATSTSLVRKGTRNVFAPPTPPSRIDFGQDAPMPNSVSRLRNSMSHTVRESFGQALTSDLPVDLRNLNTEGVSAIDPSAFGSLRGMPQCAGLPATQTLLPSLPEQSHLSSGRVSPIPPQLTLDLVESRDNRASIFSEFLEPLTTDRNSFDFTGEYAALDLGHERASFVEALAQMQSTRHLILPSLPPTPIDVSRVRDDDDSLQQVSDVLGEDSESEDEVDEEAEDRLEVEISTAQVHLTPRPAPFQGQAAFQAHVAHLNLSPPRAYADKPERLAQPFDFVSRPAAIERPQQVQPNQPSTSGNTRQGHHRGQSGSMSSMGSLIEDGIPTDFTNYFEIHFAAHLNGQNRARVDSQTSSGGRMHHRRNSSIVSVESINEELSRVLNDMGPPISMHNSRRSSYLSRHRRSSESFGRSDWAAHKRTSSVGSSSSAISFARIGRPGLGDRMFQLDGGVQLSSITGSPAGDGASEAPTPLAARQQSSRAPDMSEDSLINCGEETYDSLINSSAERPQPDSLLDASARIDNIFGDSPLNAEERRFMLKGLRPNSFGSTATSSALPVGGDTYHNYDNNTSPVPKGQAACLEANGEDSSFARSLGDSNISGRQVLNASISRPPKPRRRPANLVFHRSSVLSQPDTPALSSPSASEASSRLSLETKFSDVPSIFSASQLRSGHIRQKSSAGIGAKLQATIKEERSTATLRAGRKAQLENGKKARKIQASPGEWDDGDSSMETVRSWVEWKREADDEYRRTRTYWVDDEESKNAMAEFKLPMSYDEIAQFIAKSAEAYRPLEQLPIGRNFAPRRRKSSLSQARQFLSPYGLPLPRPPIVPREQRPKMSLPTKFERTRSSTGSQFTIESDAPTSAVSTPSRGPLSAVFAQFAREVPSSPLSVPHTASSATIAPSATYLHAQKAESILSGSPKNDVYSAAGRQRVNSKARRQALGWGRRRNSDGPTKVEQMSRVFERMQERSQGDDGDLEGLPLDLQESLKLKSRLAKPFASRSANIETDVSRVSAFSIPARIAPKAQPVAYVPAKKSGGGSMGLRDKENRPVLSVQTGPTLRVKPSREGRSTGYAGVESIAQQTKAVRPKSSRSNKAAMARPAARPVRA